MTFSEKLNEYLKMLDVTYFKFANAIGMSVSTVARYKNGEREPAFDSEHIKKIANGLFLLSREKGLGLSEEEILTSLQKTLKNALRIDYDTYVSNLNALLMALDIRVSALARALSFDTSHISKVLSGQRRPGRIADFTQKIGSYISRAYSDEKHLKTIAGLIGCEESSLQTPRAVKDTIVEWLGSNTSVRDNEPITHFLRKMETFRLDEFIQSIHFNDIKLPTAPFQLPTSKTYTSLDGMKKCEIDFIKATVLSKSKKDCILYSNMPMEEMAKDEDFAKKWMFGMAMMLKKGLHLNIIHDVNRPFHEMMLGLEGNIPMYMTGQISPWYLPHQQDDALLYLLKVSGAAAMEGSAVSGYHAEGRYLLTKSDEDVRFFQKKAQRLLEKARPLMEIYRSDHKREYLTALKKTWQNGDRLTVSSALPIFTLSKKALQSILSRNGTTPAHAQDIEEFRQHYFDMATEYLRNNHLSMVVPNPGRKEFESAPINMALSEMFYEIDVPYTYDEYTEHLHMTMAFAAENPNLTLQLDPSPVFRNITYSVVGDKLVIVSKNQSPTIHFVIHHKKMVQAFQNFIPPLREK